MEHKCCPPSPLRTLSQRKEAQRTTNLTLDWTSGHLLIIDTSANTTAVDVT